MAKIFLQIQDKVCSTGVLSLQKHEGSYVQRLKCHSLKFLDSHRRQEV